ncbi:MAG: AAA family ATPase, partial [Clostridiaceae bacterium]
MKKIPYGISNFERLIEENYLYVDKTKYIEMLEQFPPYQFFIRPRRFGKSLFISMLENYYDVNKKDKFETLFGDFYIGENPTEERNKYLVFKISFAGIDTTQGKEKLIKSFDGLVLNSAEYFLRKYKDILEEDKLPENIIGAEMAIRYLALKVQEVNKKLFVLIDEYDNFANAIMNANKDLYYDLISG